MCGFFVSNDPFVVEDHEDLICSNLRFRGPDGNSGLILFKEWKLFHARLAIIAPSSVYNQPFFSESGSVLIFNGEILNFKELALLYGISPSNSDTYVLASLLDIPCFNLSELDGFFSFVRIDHNGNLTHCARDKFGVKPLFYFRRNGYITISSEPNVICSIFSNPLSQAALDEYRVFRSPIFSQSYYHGIASVSPGTCLVNGSYFSALAYFSEDYMPEQDIVSCLQASVTSRLIADSSVGLLFSAGIDSNLVNHFSSRKLDKLCGSVALSSDLEYAYSYGDLHANEKVYTSLISSADFLNTLNSMVRLRKEPLSVPNEVVLALLAAQWSSLGGKVLLSGEGADEFFGGYDRIFRWAYFTEIFDIYSFISHYAYAPIDKIPKHIIQNLQSFFTPISHLSCFEQVRYFFIVKHLPVLFRRLDFSLMFGGIEGREPLASFSLFKVAMSCSPECLMNTTHGKVPLRIIAESIYGSDFAFSPKVGFPVNISQLLGLTSSDSRINDYDKWFQLNLDLLV